MDPFSGLRVNLPLRLLGRRRLRERPGERRQLLRGNRRGFVHGRAVRRHRHGSGRWGHADRRGLVDGGDDLRRRSLGRLVDDRHGVIVRTCVLHWGTRPRRLRDLGADRDQASMIRPDDRFHHRRRVLRRAEQIERQNHLADGEVVVGRTAADVAQGRASIQHPADPVGLEVQPEGSQNGRQQLGRAVHRLHRADLADHRRAVARLHEAVEYEPFGVETERCHLGRQRLRSHLVGALGGGEARADDDAHLPPRPLEQLGRGQEPHLDEGLAQRRARLQPRSREVELFD